MIEITCARDLAKTDFENIEHKHLTLILFMKKAQSFFFEVGELLGDKDSLSSLQKLFLSLPKEVLADCGYQKNNGSFYRMKSMLNLLNNEDVYNVAISTESEELPNKEELSFLREGLSRIVLKAVS